MENHKKMHLEKTLVALSYNILGILLPFILSLLPIIALRKYDNIVTFVDEGQILLFSAGLYTNSIFLFNENKRSLRIHLDKILSNSVLWLLIISSAFYAIIYCLNLLKSVPFTTDKIFIRIASIILFVISTCSIYRGVFIDCLKIYPDVDVREQSKVDVEDIMKKL